MVNSFLISFIVGAGIGVWVYNKFQRSSGGNSRNSAIASAIVAILITIAGTIVLDMFIKKHK